MIMLIKLQTHTQSMRKVNNMYAKTRNKHIRGQPIIQKVYCRPSTSLQWYIKKQANNYTHTTLTYMVHAWRHLGTRHTCSAINAYTDSRAPHCLFAKIYTQIRIRAAWYKEYIHNFMHALHIFTHALNITYHTYTYLNSKFACTCTHTSRFTSRCQHAPTSKREWGHRM